MAVSFGMAFSCENTASALNSILLEKGNPYRFACEREGKDPCKIYSESSIDQVFK